MTSEEAAQYARVTLRQLQYWDENGVVVAERNGHGRDYTERQAMELRVLAEFRRKGVSLQRLKSLMPEIRKDMERASHRRYPRNGIYPALLGIFGPTVLLIVNLRTLQAAADASTLRQPLIVTPLSFQ